MSSFKVTKILTALPATLAPDTMYFVRVGQGFDMYVTDTLGDTAHTSNNVKINKIDYMQSDVEDGYVYARYKLHGVDVISRFDKTVAYATNITDISADWINRSTLTYA